MEALYTPEILRWAMQLPESRTLEEAAFTVTKTSRVCGSSLTMSVCLSQGKITDFAVESKACALGQASAAMVLSNLDVLDKNSLAAVARDFEAMLESGTTEFETPWKELSILAPVRDHPGRFGSVRLPFQVLAEIFDLAENHAA